MINANDSIKKLKNKMRMETAIGVVGGAIVGGVAGAVGGGIGTYIGVKHFHKKEMESLKAKLKKESRWA